MLSETTKAPRVTGASRLVEVLEREGVEVVFGLPGVHNLGIWEALSRSAIRLIGVRHEQTAVYAADGYARSTGRVGVALVTTGPGAANTLAATGEAGACGSAVVVIATDVPSRLRRPGVNRGVLHECRDQAAIFAPVVKSGSTTSSAAGIGPDLAGACRTALRAPSGPVYLGIPTDFLAAPTADLELPRDRDGSIPVPAEDELDAGAEILRAAATPLICAGGGAIRANAGEAIGRLAERLAAPVVTTYTAKGLLPIDHPCSVPWTLHAPQVGALWDEADLVLAIGTELDGMTTQNWALPEPPELVAINVDAEDAAKNYQPKVALVGDAAEVTRRLVDRLPTGTDLAGLESRISAIGDELTGALATDDAEALSFVEAVAAVSSRDVSVVADMCIPGYWLGGFLPVGRPRSFAYPVGWGTLGFGFPASIGVAAGGASRVVSVCGDGGFLFACGELATVAQEQLPVTVVLVDDGGYGMLRHDQIQAGNDPFGVDLLTPDFAALAASFGVDAVAVDGFGAEFRQRLDELVGATGPNLLLVRAKLRPPLNTSPRWYRRAPEVPSNEQQTGAP